VTERCGFGNCVARLFGGLRFFTSFCGWPNADRLGRTVRLPRLGKPPRELVDAARVAFASRELDSRFMIPMLPGFTKVGTNKAPRAVCGLWLPRRL